MDPRILQEDAKPERFHWLVWVIVLLGLAALVGFAIVPGVRIKQRDSAFRDVHEGDARGRVVELMGAPDSDSEPAHGDLCRWWGDEVNPACKPEDLKIVLTWRIRSFLLPVTWQVGFDNESRAIAKHRYD